MEEFELADYRADKTAGAAQVLLTNQPPVQGKPGSYMNPRRHLFEVVVAVTPTGVPNGGAAEGYCGV